MTPYSPVGNRARGTLNNCGKGYTTWGTYLTCEENWPGYFTNSGTLTAEQERIGLSTEGTRYGLDTVAGDETEIDSEFARFDVTPTAADASSDYRNEANGHGYITEIDPYNPESMATKRTAMGRFRHESCVFGKLVEGQTAYRDGTTGRQSDTCCSSGAALRRWIGTRSLHGQTGSTGAQASDEPNEAAFMPSGAGIDVSVCSACGAAMKIIVGMPNHSIEDRTIIGKLLSHLETTSCTPPAGLASCAVGARAPPPGSC